MKNDDGKPQHLRLVETKQDLDTQIIDLLNSAFSSENEQETLARMDEESKNFERITGIQAWGPALKDLGRLAIHAPFHHSKIAKLNNSKELFYDIRKKRLDVNDSRYIGWFGFTMLFFGIIIIVIGLLLPNTTKSLASLISALFLVLTGTGLTIYSVKVFLEPWSWCRRLRPYVDSLYAGRDD